MPRKNPSRLGGARLLLFPFTVLATLAGWQGAAAHFGGRGAADAPDDSGGARPLAEFLRAVPLPANGVVYNPADQLLYVSVPSSAGAAGNSIVPVNPLDGSSGQPAFVGSEPGQLVLADDNRTLYVTLAGAHSVRRFDTQTRTAGVQFALGHDTFYGRVFRAQDLSVAPGNPNLLAVARQQTGPDAPKPGVAVFDNGARREKTGEAGNWAAESVAFSASESKLYGGGNLLLKAMTVDATGVAAEAEATTFFVGPRIRFAGGRVYSSSGQVVDPATGALLGRFAEVSRPGTDAVFVPDPATGRAYYLGIDYSGVPTLRAYDLNTFAHVGTAQIFPVEGTPTTLVRWGANGLAFTTTSSRLYVVQTSLVPSSEGVPTPTPATPTPTPTLAPAPPPTFVREIRLSTSDLAYSAHTRSIYVSTPADAGAAGGNSVIRIEPQTGELGQPTFVGSGPSVLALSDDGRTMYVGLSGENAVRRFDVTTQTAGLQFPVGSSPGGHPYLVNDIAVMPGSPGTVAVSRATQSFVEVSTALFDDGAPRPQAANQVGFQLAFGPPSALYARHTQLAGNHPIYELAVGTAGLTKGDAIPSPGGIAQFAGGLLYLSNGYVVDPAARAVRGRFAIPFDPHVDAMAVDAAAGRAFFMHTGLTPDVKVIRSYDINTFLPVSSVSIDVGPESLGSVTTRLLRWGENGLAFRSRTKIFLVQSKLVNDSATVPTGLRLSSDAYGAREGADNSVTITVRRTGDVSGASTVNYATSAGTAAAGSDYAATSGTLNFAAGESSKTFAVPVIDDNIFEESETFNVSLSSPTGAALVSQDAAVVTISDNESQPSITPGSLTVVEGDSGATAAEMSVRLTNPTAKTVTVNYATSDGTATAGVDFTPASGTLTFQPGDSEKMIALQIIGDTADEGNENFFVDFTNPINANSFVPRGAVTILDDERPTVQFSAAVFGADEGGGRATITVTRFGPVADPAAVDYFTFEDTRPVPCAQPDSSGLRAAFGRCDYSTTFDTLNFAPGERQKTFTVPLVDDGHDEWPEERVRLGLSRPVGVTLGLQQTADLLIADDDGPDAPNPVGGHAFFVRQHYLDFLSREPEQGEPWTGVLERCADAFNTDADSPSAGCDRHLVSSAFFRSREFELKGYFVLRFYRAVFNRLPRYPEFVFDMRRVAGQTTEEVFAKRQAFAEAWVQRQEFLSLHGGKANARLVDDLLARYNVTAINAPDPAAPNGEATVTLTRDQLIAALDSQQLTKAQVVRAFVESREVDAREFNGAFVAMQYFGYLRRDPEPGGYQAWLNVLNRGDGFRVMIDGFMNSQEYRLRFGRQ